MLLAWNSLSGFLGTMASIGTAAATGGASIWPSVIGNVAGNLLNSATSSYFQGQAMNKQFELQKKLFEYENTHKHQFEVEDLKAAGLNPILSAMNGSSVGVGGVGISSPISGDNVFSSAQQVRLAQSQQAIEKQNADTNSLVGASQSGKNYADMRLAEANTNTANRLLPLTEKQKNTEISNSVKVADAQAAYYYAAGSAAQLQASAAAADHYQNVAESIERSAGYRGQRPGQEIKNREDLAHHQFENWRRELRMGRRLPASAIDLWRGFYDSK